MPYKQDKQDQIRAAYENRIDVEYIPPTIFQCEDIESDEPLRVAPYCRVSTSSEDQRASYETQIQAYKDLVAKHEDWVLVDIYADDSDIFEPSQKVLAKPSVFLIWSNFLSFWANIHGGVAWDIFFLPVILREGAEKQLLY